MAVIKSDFYCDLNKPVKVQYLDGNLFSQDNMGNIFNVYVMDGGQPATIAGTVSADVIRSDGGTVPVSGSISGNTCSVTFPQAVYAVPGVVSIVIKLTNSGTVTTVCAVVANVYRSSTDVVVDPGTILPSIQTLIAQINAAVASIPADYSALWAKLAPAFSTDSSYSIGQYATYNGGLYRFRNAHSGAWSSTDAQAVDIGGELYNAAKNRLNFLVLEQGSISTSGNKTDAANRVRTVTKIQNPTHIDVGNTAFRVLAVVVYNNGTDQFVSYTNPQGAEQRIIDIVPSSGTYAKVVFKEKNDNNFTPGDIQPDLTLCNFENRIQALEDSTNNLHNQANTIQDVVSTNKSVEFTVGAYIDTSQGAVGSVVDTTPVANASYAYSIVSCKAGDVFTVTGTGGASARLWCFVDSEYKKISTATASATETSVAHTATTNGYFICNVTVSDEHSVIKKTVGAVTFDTIVESIDGILETIDNVTHVTNPHLLAWRMGVFTEAGPQAYTQGILPKDRFFTIVKLKKGSMVSKKPSSRGRNISFGYKLSESDETLSGYTSNAGDYIVVNQDCIAYIGIRYSNPVEDLPNDNILDTFDFDLYVIDYLSRYNRSQGVGGRYYGFPCPEIYYEGQHEDVTGWNNEMSDIQAVYDAFDTLCAASNGYLTRTQDYGVAYTGNAGNALYPADSEWHLYGYTAKPASAQTAVKIAITCCIHGNEKMSVYALYYLMYDLVYNSTKNPVLSYLKSNCVIVFMPICNPYGFMREIPSRVNENGVNINRNFPTYNWADWEDGTGTVNYKGASAGSEPETQLVMRFFRDNYDSIFSVDIHTDGADTKARDEISSFMMTMPSDTTDPNYKIQESFLAPGLSFTRRLKPWMNDNYQAGMSYSLAWGNASAMGAYPSCPEWIRQAVGTPGLCYEVLAGSSTGYVGSVLTQYGAQTIKLAAEEIGAFLATITAHCKGLNG